MNNIMSPAEHTQSREEGWIFTGATIIALHRGQFLLDSTNYPVADAQALEFVKQAAAAGSEMHQKAIAALIAFKIRYPTYA